MTPSAHQESRWSCVDLVSIAERLQLIAVLGKLLDGLLDVLGVHSPVQLLRLVVRHLGLLHGVLGDDDPGAGEEHVLLASHVKSCRWCGDYRDFPRMIRWKI